VACILALIFGVALTEPLRAPARIAGSSAPGIDLGALPHRFWLYAAAVGSLKH